LYHALHTLATRSRRRNAFHTGVTRPAGPS
jgi:hypothetical protein